MLKMVCNNVQIEPVLQEINGKVLIPGTNRAADAWLDIHVRGFWERQGSAFFDVRMCYSNAESCIGLTTKKIYRRHESEKKRMYISRVQEVEQGPFTPLVSITTGGIEDEFKRYHSGLTELLSANLKGEDYSATMSWIRVKVSFTLLRPAPLCLTGSRYTRRAPLNITDNDFEIDKELARS